MRNFQRLHHRRVAGLSIVEMMVAVAVLGVAIAGITETIWVNGAFMTKLGNKLDNVLAARQMLERLGPNLRMGRNVGDGLVASNQFPLSTNPLWGTSGQGPYTLSNTQLIVQVPVFDTNGYPTVIPVGQGNPVVSINMPNVDTYVYQVVADPDPQAPGPYMMQVQVFPGYNSTTNNGQMGQMQTVVRGIVGPTDTAGNLQTFQYFDNTNTLIPGTSIVSFAINAPDKIAVNIEIRHQSTGATYTIPSTTLVRDEFFLRNKKAQG
ncbi:MAG TPA: prepilin-type N-terminal cleavage/methylation domain-containing protein [Oculatellaceae cyanobacterium]